MRWTGLIEPTSLSPRHHVRRGINIVFLATPLGLALASLGSARIHPGPHGTWVATEYRSRFPAPRASAVTIGDVILLRLTPEQLKKRPGLLRHEVKHSTQWAFFLGVVGFPLAYGMASIWSLIRCKDAAHRNIFECRAGLTDGGYDASDKHSQHDVRHD
ncbi:MAG: hypothetical protein ACRCTR_07510 [Actinomycetota bacterium]